MFYKNYWVKFFLTVSLGGLLALFWSCATVAENVIVTDDTLGPETSQRERIGSTTDFIRGGATRESNLFHSFLEFNISEIGQVYFESPDGIENIFSRVTGSNPSNILGTLGVDGTANLFLINPNGISFGENANLDVDGSFFATTADAIQLGDQGLFSATEPENSSLLTVRPSAFLFSQAANQSSSSIQNQATLAVQPNQNLFLVGGEIVLNGGRLNAPDGRIELASVTRDETVDLLFDAGVASLGSLNNVSKADVSLLNGSQVDVRGTGSGSIAINARNVEISGISQLFSGINTSPSNNDNQPGDILINATESIVLTDAVRVSGDWNRSSISNTIAEEVEVEGSDNLIEGGNIRIAARSIQVTEGAEVVASTFGEGGKTGDIIIEAVDSFHFEGGVEDNQSFASSRILNRVENGAIGQSGTVDITVGNGVFLIANGAILSVSTFSQGNSGNIIIEAEGPLVLSGLGPDNFGGIYNQVLPDAVGEGGDIIISAESLSVIDGAVINQNTRGQGNGGSVDINTRSFVSVRGVSPNGNVFSSITARTEGPGDAGEIEIETGYLEIVEGGQVSTATDSPSSTGDGGNLSIIASGSLVIRGSSTVGVNREGDHLSRLTTRTEGPGDAGNLSINTRNLLIEEGAQVSSGNNSLSATGNAGDTGIVATESVYVGGASFNNLDVSRLTSRTEGQGSAGTLEIDTSALFIELGGQVSAGTFGNGAGGTINIDATDLVQLSGFTIQPLGTDVVSRIGARTQGSGTAGEVILNTRDLIVQNGAQITSGTFTAGEGGNLTVNASGFIELSGTSPSGFPGGLLVRTFGEGTTGRLHVTTGALTLQDGAQIAANGTNLGDAGDIVVNIQDALEANNSSIVTSAETSSGGTILINAGSIRLNGSSDIRTNVNSGANSGGNITLRASSILAFDDSDILAFAQDGQGGNINLDTPAFFGENYRPSPEGIDSFSLDGNNRVDINASGAISGVVTIPDVSFIENSLNELPEAVIITEQLIAGSCIARTDDGGSFIISGSGGLPERPSTTIMAPYSTGEIRPLGDENSAGETEDSDTWQPGDPMVEPQGLFELPDGRLIATRECVFE